MKRRLNILSFMSFMVLAVVAAMSCERRNIYEEGRTAMPVLVQMDWRNLGGDPDGATIVFYPEDGSTPYMFKTNSVGRAKVKVPSGYYTVIVFNRTVDEYGTMRFYNMSSLGQAKVLLDSKYYGWVGTADSVGRTVYEPELIVCGRTDHFLVRERSTSVVKEHESSRVLTRGETTSTANNVNTPDTVYVTPQRMVYNADFNVRVNGIQNVKSVRAYVTGMAGGQYLATRSATDTIATHVLEDWTVDRDDSDYTKGYLKTSFACFGLPQQYKNSDEPTNEHLFMKILLVDGTTVITEGFDVGDLIRQYDNELELDLVVGLETRQDDDPIDLPDVKPESGNSSGFDVNLEDWGETYDYIVPAI